MNETTLGRGARQASPASSSTQRAADDVRGCGQALVGRLLKACLDRGIEPRTGHAATELVIDDGRVVGVRFATPDGPVEVATRGGVILATGGFEWNKDLVRSFIRGPLERTVAIETNTGDGLKMAMRAGASLGNMSEAWWVPIIDVTDDEGETTPVARQPRTCPGRGRSWSTGPVGVSPTRRPTTTPSALRSTSSTPAASSTRNLPAFLVFDQQYLAGGGIAGFKGEGAVPEWLTCADSLAELADLIGVDGVGLEETVARWNAQVADLDDPDFGRGRSINDTHWGDGSRTLSATLGPIDAPPYYAVQVRPGALGTKGGPRTDGVGQVLDLDDRPIPGLYAAGNVMASAMGMTYGGAGGTLGPGMVFGFAAGRAAAQAAG